MGGRFTEDPPLLEWICFHVLAEYARHAGQFDVVRELSGSVLNCRAPSFDANSSSRLVLDPEHARFVYTSVLSQNR